MLAKIIRSVFIGILVIAICSAVTGYLISTGMKPPIDMSAGSSILAQVFAVSGLVWIVIYCGFSDVATPTVKLIGSVLVLALAFASNSAWTYALSIFIVATLVTELEFLEKLAALFTNRKEYWEWRSKQSTEAEAERKALADAFDDEIYAPASKSAADKEIPDKDVNMASDGAGSQSVNATIEESSELSSSEEKSSDKVEQALELALKYERVIDTPAQVKAAMGIQFAKRVATALRAGNSPLGIGDVLENMVYQKGAERLEIDAVVKSEGVHYVVEIKYAFSGSSVDKALWNLTRLAKGYADYIVSMGMKVLVRKVLILPFETKYQPIKSRYDNVDIYFFDTKTNGFFRFR